MSQQLTKLRNRCTETITNAYSAYKYLFLSRHITLDLPNMLIEKWPFEFMGTLMAHSGGLFLPTLRQLGLRSEFFASVPYLGGIFLAGCCCHRQFFGNFFTGPLDRRTAIPIILHSLMLRPKWESTTKEGTRKK